MVNMYNIAVKEPNSIKMKVSKNNVWSISKKSKVNKSKSVISHLNQKTNTKPRKMLSFKEFVTDEKKENFTENEKLPNKIEGVYVYDYNILRIHRILMKKFNQDKRVQILILQEKIKIENEKIKTRQSIIERKASKKQLLEYNNKIKEYEANVHKKAYVKRTKHLIDEYKTIGSITQVVNFFSTNKDEKKLIAPESEDKQIKRHEIISEYLEVARRYITIDLIRDIPNANCCPGCGINNDDIDFMEDEFGSHICPNCNLEKINIIRQPFYVDGCRVNNSRNNYEDRANFEKVMLRFQGKQANKPPKELYKKLNIWFIKSNLSTKDEYRNLPLLSDGTKEGTSRDLMYKALAEIGCSGYYDDINLIMNVFWGWELHDIGHLEQQIMRDYDLFQNVYDNLIDKEGRKSSLNSQWRLYKHLRRLNYPCNANEFKIPTTPDILEYHKVKWRDGCEILGWKDV